jgi:threonine/homoserine/homoserine lactone efflux protein
MASVLITIWLLHTAALMTPGANVLLVIQQAGSSRRAGAMTALGVAAGTLIWSGSAVLGIGALFAAAPRLRLVLQVAGAVYLLSIAWSLWRSRTQPSQRGKRPSKSFRSGVLTSLSNPKSALFFSSVFSSALPAEPGAALLAAAVLLVVLNDLILLWILALLVSSAPVSASQYGNKRLLTSIGAGALGALGLFILGASVHEARN